MVSCVPDLSSFAPPDIAYCSEDGAVLLFSRIDLSFQSPVFLLKIFEVRYCRFERSYGIVFVRNFPLIFVNKNLRKVFAMRLIPFKSMIYWTTIGHEVLIPKIHV